jgi:hypothetical protein
LHAISCIRSVTKEVITYPCDSDCFWIVLMSSSFQFLVVLLRSCPCEVPTTPLYIFPESGMCAGSALPRIDNRDGKNKNACRRRKVSMGHIVCMTLQVEPFSMRGRLHPLGVPKLDLRASMFYLETHSSAREDGETPLRGFFTGQGFIGHPIQE